MTDRSDQRWNLDDLYTGPSDPAIKDDGRQALLRAAEFRERFRGKVSRLDAEGLAGLLTAYEEILRLVRKPGQYASLRFAVATGDEAAQAELGLAQQLESEVNQELAFFHVELKDLAVRELLDGADAATLAPWRHYLEQQITFAPFTLSEEAERTVARKDLTGKTAWVQLYQQQLAAVMPEVKLAGGPQVLTRAEAMALRSDPDRSTREAATEALAESLRPLRPTLSFIFNTLFDDHRSDTSARGFPDVMRATVLQDDLDPAVVEALIDTVTRHRGVVARWHRVRARALGIADYGTQDLLVPAFGDEPKLSWDEARTWVQEAFDRFGPRAGAWARAYFERGWIDVFPREGKQPGAFCSPSYPPDHPYVLLNFTGRLDDAFTLAHELGHGLHFCESMVQRPVHYWTGMPLAETASVFAEMWLADLLTERRPDPTFRLQLLDRAIGDTVRTGFHQIAYVQWERAAHAARAEGAVPVERFCGLWDEHWGGLFGDAVTRKERDRWGWIAIPHFIFARFYCYSYAFGKFLTLSLYDLWKERGEAFTGPYLDLLAAGGSEAPHTLLSRMGIDVADPAFWARGCQVVERQVDAMEAGLP